MQEFGQFGSLGTAGNMAKFISIPYSKSIFAIFIAFDSDRKIDKYDILTGLFSGPSPLCYAVAGRTIK